MKKSLVAAMFAVMMISLAGCGTEVKTIETTEVVTETETEESVVEEETEKSTEVVEETEEPTEAEEVTEVAVEEPSSPYSYTELSQTMYAQSTVNVRDLPEQSGGKLGSLTTNQEVTVTGQCNETGWYRISYNGGEGFVSNSYLGSEKVAVKSSQSGSSASSQSSQSASSSQSSTASSEATQASQSQASSEATTTETPAQEAPAETTDDNPYAGMTVEEAADSITIHPDSYICPICGFETTNAEEYDAHLAAEGVQ